jgi:hypothetical protein
VGKRRRIQRKPHPTLKGGEKEENPKKALHHLSRWGIVYIELKKRL